MIIPPNTVVAPNVIASHTLPEFWGQDHLEWKPARWIETPGSQATPGAGGVAAEEVIKGPPVANLTFFAWSEGARVCPGKKFSQVEFVAIISNLLRSHRIEVVPAAGETPLQAMERCSRVIQDSESQITLQMRNPRSVSFRLVERGAAAMV